MFDFDGLLVDTEQIHFAAYSNTLAYYGIDISGWDFKKYCRYTHISATGLKDHLAEFYSLNEKVSNWAELYEKKRHEYTRLLLNTPPVLMEGVETLLRSLEKANIDRCVVTNSPKEHIDMIRQHNDVLNSIPNWITRECYVKPKPDPECYQYALKTIATAETKNVIGFEDTPRGTTALLGTDALPVIIASEINPEIHNFLERNPSVKHFKSLKNILDEKLP